MPIYIYKKDSEQIKDGTPRNTKKNKEKIPHTGDKESLDRCG